MKTFALLLVVGTVLSLAIAQQVRVENFPLADDVPVDCEEVIETHTFSGTCCSLNTTSGNGCVVNVANGNCVVRRLAG